MADHYQLIVRNGMLVDGSGNPRRRADVGVSEGRIAAAAGRLAGASADEEIDAEGLIVAPGVIDPHTHYDPQITWDPYATASCFHGVTTVLAGSCAFSVAPTHPDDRSFFSGLFAKVEGMAPVALDGISWEVETFPEYLVTRAGQLVVNLACYVGHCNLRRWVMGPDGSARAATTAEVMEMGKVLRQAMDAGAAGLSSTHASTHNILPKSWGPGHLPFWLAVGSPATWEKAGRLGQGALGFTFSSVHNVAPWIESYKKGISDCIDPVGEFVNDNVMITTAVRCSTDRAAARAQACHTGNAYLPSMVALYHDTMPGPGGARWPKGPKPPPEQQLDPLIDGGFLLCGSPEEICEQLQPFGDYGVDQVCFGLPGDATSHKEAIELIETFGRHVIPEFDEDPVVSTERYRALAEPKFPAFNREPIPISTLHST